jgi:hypothetical protein
MEKPKTQRAMVEQLWFVVIGSNGDGLVVLLKEALKKLIEHHGRLEDIEAAIPALWTKEQHEKMHAQFVEQEKARKEKEQKDRKQGDERRKVSRRDWIMIVIVAAGIVVPFVLEKIF